MSLSAPYARGFETQKHMAYMDIRQLPTHVVWNTEAHGIHGHTSAPYARGFETQKHMAYMDTRELPTHVFWNQKHMTYMDTSAPYTRVLKPIASSEHQKDTETRSVIL